jgi:hypothetical protein
MEERRYNQTAAEAYFTDQYQRIWDGLTNLMAAYGAPRFSMPHSFLS